MLTLQHALQDQDPGYFQIVAEFWGLELGSVTVRQAQKELSEAMLQPNLAREVVEMLPAEARAALDWLLGNGGRAPAAQFARDFGEIRPMGPGRRDREMPWLDPVSPAEVLWYHGLIARTFADGAKVASDFQAAVPAAVGPREIFFIPDDLTILLPSPARVDASDTPGEPFDLPEHGHINQASSALVDDSATLLAALRREPSPHSERLARDLQPFLLTGNEEEGRRNEAYPAGVVLALLIAILQDMGCLGASTLELNPTVTRPFLEKPRGEQLAALFNAWRESATWNDLQHVPGLVSEGNWRNEPALARGTVLAFLNQVPADMWWSLESFVAAIKERHPDFQRPAGDYDSWYLRDKFTGEFLRGFDHWDRLDGALIRFLITGPLHWLGATDIHPHPDPPPPEEHDRARSMAFRVTSWGRALLASEIPQIAEPPGQLRVYADGRLSVDRSVSRYERFQAARFTDWVGLEQVYVYRISANSLALAEKQGVQVRHILAFLSKSASNPVPPSLAEALARWEQHGAEANAVEMLVLKLKSPELLETLRKSPKASRYLGEALGPAAVEVRRRDWEKLRAAMAEMGILVDLG